MLLVWVIIIIRIYICLNGPNKFNFLLMLNDDFFFQNLQFLMSRILIIGTPKSPYYNTCLGWPLGPQHQRAELGLVTALCVPVWWCRIHSEHLGTPEDIPCLFLALCHYLFALGKLQRNACFLLKHHRLSSPGQVFSPVRWLFLSGFILVSFREEKKTQI